MPESAGIEPGTAAMAVVHSSTSQFELQSRHEVGVDANFIFCTLSHRFTENNSKKQSEETSVYCCIGYTPHPPANQKEERVRERERS
jgi:hypothetical protein